MSISHQYQKGPGPVDLNIIVRRSIDRRRTDGGRVSKIWRVNDWGCQNKEIKQQRHDTILTTLGDVSILYKKQR